MRKDCANGRGREVWIRQRSLRRRSVENCKASIEIGGVGNPNEVGDEEASGHLGSLGKCLDCQDDAQPKQDNHHERRNDEVGTEEEGRPSEIEDELGEKIPVRQFFPMLPRCQIRAKLTPIIA